MLARSDKLEVKPASDGIGGARQDGQRDSLILRIKKAIELRPTGMKPLRHLGFAYILLLHRLLKLIGEHAFDGVYRRLFVEKILRAASSDDRSLPAMYHKWYSVAIIFKIDEEAHLWCDNLER